jgi:hypothetical protein
MGGKEVGGDSEFGCASCRTAANGKLAKHTPPLEAVGGLEKVSATTLSDPRVCLRSVVNSEMYSFLYLV